MPAFSFEKISPPVRPEAPAPAAESRRRGLFVKLLGRFAEARVKRSLQNEVPADLRRETTVSE